MPRIDMIRAFTRGWALFADDPLRLVGILLVGALLSLTVFLAPMMIAGSCFVYGRIARGERPALADLFAPFNAFERFLMGSLVYLGAQVVWMVAVGWIPLLGVAAGFVVNAFFLLYLPLMAHRGLDATGAFRACRELFPRHWLSLLALAGVLTLLIWVGALALLFGLAVSLPYALAVIQAVYEQIDAAPAAPPDAPAATPPATGGEPA